ncbi:hypothetical protein TNCV_1207111 [Trichonephila clavipes]|nr:hypothetical protein TNCV_1207111 [Trichonephila clavipes]
MTIQFPLGSRQHVGALSMTTTLWSVCKDSFIQFYKGTYSSQKTIDVCISNGLINTEPGRLIGNKLSFLMNPALICGTMMAAFFLDAMPVNTVLPECFIECHSGRSPGVVVWRAILYHG